MTPPKKRGPAIDPADFEELEAKALANIAQKIAAGGIPTKRERELLRQAALIGAAADEQPDGPAELVTQDERRPWDTRARRALIDLEPEVERILRDGGPDGERLALEYAVSRGAPVTQAKGQIEAIKARWRAVMDDPERSKTQASIYQARLEAAWSWASNKPLLNPLTGEPLVTEHGVAVVGADLKAVPNILKLMAAFHGLDQPAKVAHLHGHMNIAPPAAMSPSERAAEIDRLLAKHRAALAAGKAPESPVAPGPTPAAAEGLDS